MAKRQWLLTWTSHAHEQANEGREIRTPNLLIWSQTRCRCAIPPSAKMSLLSHNANAEAKRGHGVEILRCRTRLALCAHFVAAYV